MLNSSIVISPLVLFCFQGRLIKQFGELITFFCQFKCLLALAPFAILQKIRYTDIRACVEIVLTFHFHCFVEKHLHDFSQTVKTFFRNDLQNRLRHAKFFYCDKSSRFVLFSGKVNKAVRRTYHIFLPIQVPPRTDSLCDFTENSLHRLRLISFPSAINALSNSFLFTSIFIHNPHDVENNKPLRSRKTGRAVDKVQADIFSLLSRGYIYVKLE